METPMDGKPIDPRDYSVTTKRTWEPALITKSARQSVTEFYEVCEKKGIARECLQCKGKRRYAMVQCPYCKDYQFRQIERTKRCARQEDQDQPAPVW